MAVFNIEKMKVISPSPDNFIVKLTLDNDKEYNYIASGEHIYLNKDGMDDKLFTQHVVHSTIYKYGDTVVTAFNLFDLNDVGITTHDNSESILSYTSITSNYDSEVIDNLLLMPNSNIFPEYKGEYDIPMHSINSNAVYGYVKTIYKSFGYPQYVEDSENKQYFNMSTHNANILDDCGKTDTLTLYNKNKNGTNITNVLALGNQSDISQNEEFGFDKLFVFDPTNDNKFYFPNELSLWRNYQTNYNNIQSSNQYAVTNNFDNGTLLVRSILWPKQTLNNEYSTERNKNIYDSSITTPYAYARKYNWNDEYFYSNGMQIVFNHRDENKFIGAIFKSDVGGTMITSTYSKRLGNNVEKQHSFPTVPRNITIPTEYYSDYNSYDTFSIDKSDYNTHEGIFNQYTPELLNRENETLSDTSLMTSKHKANIFDIQFKELWRDICDKFPSDDGYSEVKNNLKNSIKTNLYKLVEEIKPAHTHLYKIVMDSED